MLLLILLPYVTEMKLFTLVSLVRIARRTLTRTKTVVSAWFLACLRQHTPPCDPACGIVGIVSLAVFFVLVIAPWCTMIMVWYMYNGMVGHAGGIHKTELFRIYSAMLYCLQ